jgi:5-amino-6-(5-phosphoribosylamino)uracil reductase
VRHDDPRLLVRDPGLRARRSQRGLPETPAKVTVTKRGMLDRSARFFADDGSAKLVYAASPVVEGVTARVGPVAEIVDGGEPLCLAALAEDLHHRGVRRLMVEGGSSVHTQLLADDLVDELQLVVAPFFVGEAGARRFVGEGHFPWHPGRRAVLAETRRLGDVCLLRYALSDRYDEEDEMPDASL